MGTAAQAAASSRGHRLRPRPPLTAAPDAYDSWAQGPGGGLATTGKPSQSLRRRRRGRAATVAAAAATTAATTPTTVLAMALPDRRRRPLPPLAPTPAVAHADD
ncbi:hypothetical protein I4F81_001542 [Pyropia yezoensis]|uniref:Uncharacterized protein n=1 Tax=Pyropia yezoensis TaxID=2788 RepID=A0ACC3BMV1_PYRYE|nr:hypothetical protein I4F81_001542 [Neopyropia yezoensis]